MTTNYKPDNSALSIQASEVFGINRLAKLTLVIDGQII